MKLPEPYAYMAIGGSIWVHKGSPDDTALYSEAQLREALASNKAVMRTALEALEKALAEPAVDPVAWRVHPATYGVGHDGVYALTTRTEQVDAWRRKGWDVEPLYTSPPPPAEHGCKFPMCQTEEYQQMLGAQVARELIGVPLLSDEEIIDAGLSIGWVVRYMDKSESEFARAIEQLVRRKAGL